MVAYLATVTLLSGSAYALLLGSGRALPPRRLAGNDYVAIVGRVALFLGMLSLPLCFGFSWHDVQGWLEDIWTTGGGAGTG